MGKENSEMTLEESPSIIANDSRRCNIGTRLGTLFLNVEESDCVFRWLKSSQITSTDNGNEIDSISDKRNERVQSNNYNVSSREW